MSFRPEHHPHGDPCELCTLPAARHRSRSRARGLYFRSYNPKRADYRKAYSKKHPRPRPALRVIFIDGEGQGRRKHLYNFVGAADEHGKTWELGDDPRKQVSTEDFLEFLLDLPGRALVVAFADLYDLSKGLEGLPDQALGDLFHESRRLYWKDGRARYRPVRWNGYKLNYINRRFSVTRISDKRRVTVWDVFAFFQSKFTKACLDWKVGTPDEIKQMERMKERRADFDAQSFEEIKAYCLTECRNGAQLTRSLLDAHERADLKLKSYFGCGSTASALMNRHAVRTFKADPPDKMKRAVACAFFGGWFENAVLGVVDRPVHNADINAAYPYALTSMPCLHHGRWEWTTTNLERRMRQAKLALVHWHNPGGQGPTSWGPLPVRRLDKTIIFPLSAVEGWTWREEFYAARSGWPSVEATGAWVYKTDCDCKPFAFLSDVYLERLRLGEDTAGIPIKNGSNSCYGKLVQTLGEAPPFQSFVWGGNTTSQCRAQILGVIARHADHVLMVATDGVALDVVPELPAPRDTGTAEALTISGGKKGPLGGWTVKTHKRGMFFARPGIYFPLDMSEMTEEDKSKAARGRGLGRRALYENTERIVNAWANGDDQVELPRGQRFIGAKTGLHLRGNRWVRSDKYGKWVSWPTKVSFDPIPKRCAVLPGGRLRPWARHTAPSLPYKKANPSDEVLRLMLAKTIAEEQPSGDYLGDDHEAA